MTDDHPGVAAPLAQALAARGYAELTPVQTAVIDPALAGRDALVSAQTGSGKTVAFGLAMAGEVLAGADRLDRAGAPLALVIAPTRELALQVQRELSWLYAQAGAVVASCVGGMDPRAERRALQSGAHVVVGTPGRLKDHIERTALDLSHLRAAVLDEADEMLDMGFREDLEFILDAANPARRTLMFSATVSRPIAALAKRYQRDAARIETTAARSAHADIEYRALTVANHDRDNAIINTLRFYEPTNALVFCATRAGVNHMTARFHNRGFSVVALSGELTQNERTHALQALRDGRAQVCIATDVAARGIDLPELELVIHADLPQNTEALLHRSGRTGRAGRKGVSALIVPVNARRKAERLLHGAGVQAQWANPPSAEQVSARDDERLLADPALAEPPAEDEAEMVRRLLETHGAETLAAAFLRAKRAGRSAPEDLAPVDASPGASRPPKRAREEFGESVWVKLSVGRKQNAEARWLLPTLCTAGGITKREIGAIRVFDTETYAQIAANAADAFFAQIGPSGQIEKNIRLTRSDGPPEDDFGSRPPSAPAKKPFKGKPRADGKPYGGNGGKGRFAKGPGQSPKGGKKPFKKRD